jgi:8-oxo-dGTP pyrophosphatase MutT (NUDIX family)
MKFLSIFSSSARAVTAPRSGSGEQTSSFSKDDLTDANRTLIAEAARAALQADIDAGREPYARDFTVHLSDGRLVNVKGISAADPVVTDGTHFLMIKKAAGRWLHAGGMKDIYRNWWGRHRVETPVETALREVREEAGYVVPPEARVRVMGAPRVNAKDIRFYDPVYDEDGRLATAYGLKPGDAFIMDSVGVEIRVDTDLSKLDIVPKRRLATFEQEWQSQGLLVQAGSDAHAVGIVRAEDAALLALQGRLGQAEHYRMMHEALPAVVPAPEDLGDFGAAHPARRMMPIVDQAFMSEYVSRHPSAVPMRDAVGSVAYVMRVRDGSSALFAGPGMQGVECLRPRGAVVALNYPRECDYWDESDVTSCARPPVRVEDGVSISDLAARDEIPALSSTDIARMAYSAAQLRALPETRSEGQKEPVLTKSLLRDGIAKLPTGDREVVGTWLRLIGAQDVAAQIGLNPAAHARGPAPEAKPAP